MYDAQYLTICLHTSTDRDAAGRAGWHACLAAHDNMACALLCASELHVLPTLIIPTERHAQQHPRTTPLPAPRVPA
jgi:hypothetical protein